MIEIAGFSHHLDERLIGRCVEDLILCILGVKFGGPQSLEEGRIGQDCFRCGRQIAWADNILDVSVGLLSDPLVDGCSRQFGIMTEIERVHFLGKQVMDAVSVRSRGEERNE